MSIARDDMGNIRDMHTAAGLPHNFRDASGGTDGTTQVWRKKPTVITPGKGLGSNPYSGRMTSSNARQVEGRNDRAGPSSTLRSSSRHTPKRQKLGHPEQHTLSKYFHEGGSPRKRAPAVPSTSKSAHPNLTTAEIITIDEEDDTPATNDDPHDPTAVENSSPDPMDFLNSKHSYAFDQKKPTPMDLFSTSWEEERKSPQDGASTQRVRKIMMKDVSRRLESSASRPDNDGDGVQPGRRFLSGRRQSTAQAEVSSGQGNVKEKVAFYDGKDEKEKEKEKRASPHVNLLTISKQSRKNGMKPKQTPRRDITALPLQLLDVDPTFRPSGFVSSSKPLKGKATENSVPLHLPLKEWSIGAAISPQEVALGPLVNLVVESGRLKVKDVNDSTRFELQLMEGSVKCVKYVDVKKTATSEPLIHIRPTVSATLQSHDAFKFKPGSSDLLEGSLTFKFHTSASDWDDNVYMGIVRKLVNAVAVKNEKSTLTEPAARTVWEAVMRAHESPSASNDPEPMLVDIPMENTSNPPSKPRAKLRPRTAASPVRRSARLSGEPKRHSPRPDPDEVILGYRSGTGSFNITNGDVCRLNPGEFLNDTLIEFGLKLWLADLQESNPDLASQVHVFSSFFYKKLSTKIPEEGYNSVRKWTSKFDLFQKKYIIVPINENLHWYLAIIYFPEYTLLPRPVQERKNVQPRRSTRHLGVIIDPPDALQPDPTSRQSVPPDPDPPPKGHVHGDSRSELIDPETPRTDDQRDEIDVERMVESGLARVDPTAEQVDGPQQVRAASPDTLTTYCPDSPTFVYPHSSPPTHAAILPTADPQGDGAEQLNRPASSGAGEGDTNRTSGIAPSTFYGTKSQGQGDVIPQLPPVSDNALPETEVDEDETMGNPESEPEEVTELPRTYIYTFDSLASKHPQAVKRLSKYLLMEAHDKRQLDETTLNEPKGMQAIVPHQPNYCDCGIYLLHFAKTFMKDPQFSSNIIRNRSSSQKGRRGPHEHWDGASVGSYRDELAARIHSMSEEWKRQRSEQRDSATKNLNESTDRDRDGSGAAAAPQEQHATPTASSKADNDTDSDIEVLSSPEEPPVYKGSRRERVQRVEEGTSR